MRHEYAVLLSRRTGVDLEMVEQAMRRRPNTERRNEPPDMKPPTEADERPTQPRRLSGQEKAEIELLRLLLANATSGTEIEPLWFSNQDHLRAYEIIGPAVAGLRATEQPDLGALFSDDERPAAVLLRRIAMEGRPLDSLDSVVNRLKVGAVERRIEEERRALETVDPASQEYSDQFGQLIALERQRRQLREQGSEG